MDPDTLAPKARPDGLTPRDLEVRDAAMALVGDFRFAEAAALLRLRLRETVEARETRLQALFSVWLNLPPAERPPFWEWSHGRGRDGGEMQGDAR